MLKGQSAALVGGGPLLCKSRPCSLFPRCCMSPPSVLTKKPLPSTPRQLELRRPARAAAVCPIGAKAATRQSASSSSFRQFRCDNAHCPQQIFAAQLDELAETYARHTIRQHAALVAMAFALDGEAGARLGNTLQIPMSPDILRRYIRYAPNPEPPTPEPKPGSAPEPTSEPSADCDPAYPDDCIPTPPPNLNCADIGPGLTETTMASAANHDCACGGQGAGM